MEDLWSMVIRLLRIEEMGQNSHLHCKVYHLYFAETLSPLFFEFMGIFKTWPKAFAIEIPTLIPVKDPGPVLTSISVRSFSSSLYLSSILTIIGKTFWELDFLFEV